ncbi:MAG: DUF5702 domain-containing protein [Clostridiales bacterium]|nr:DUF5702 domain-containing protein [Clostridiales bacterium]
MVSNRRKVIHWHVPAILGEEDAAVTVYFLLAGTALLILFLAVFNYGRYLSATRQTELALEASLTSVLSYYEPKLIQEMGLFALDTRKEGLQAAGRAYAVSNLGEEKAVNGQVCLDYTLYFPEESRLDLSDILAEQAVDMNRIKGWTAIGGDILQILGGIDWKGLFAEPMDGIDQAEVLGLPEIRSEAGEIADVAGAAEDLSEITQPEWLNGLEEFAETDGSGRLRIWHFLSPFPPEEKFTDRIMPGAIMAAGYGKKNSLDEQASFWANTFQSPSAAVQEEAFLTETLDQTEDFLTEFVGILAEALQKGAAKLLFTEYLLNDLDFATNKPVLDRFFSRAEAEYVLCGHASSWDNIRSVALRLYLLRTSLHAARYLIDAKALNKITLVMATITGMTKGGEDVEKLFAGERILAVPGVEKITMSYKDHLRLLLMCQPQTEQRSALQRLVQVNLWHWKGGGAGGSGLWDVAGVAGSVLGEIAGWEQAADFGLNRYTAEVRAVIETELSLWPFGSVRIRREGAMGYDRPFTLLSQE